ncbi:MAG: OmpH family outer membrane protein [Pseudomonadota bacterium]
MKKILLIISVLFVLSACDELGIESSNTILIVDMDVVAKATGKQEVMQKELEFANLQLTEQLKLVVSQLEDNVSQEKEKLGDKPTSEEQQQFEAYLAQTQNQLQNTRNLAIQQSTEFRSELILQFRAEVSKIAQAIAKERGSKLIMVVGQETLWFDAKADITDEVIALIRKRESSQANSSVSDTES